MRLYKAPSFIPQRSPVTTDLKGSSIDSTKSIFNSRDVARQYVLKRINAKPIRGRELFIRSIQRILERIRQKKQKTKTDLANDSQIFETLEESIGIFNNFTFMNSVRLKKQLLNQDHRQWAIEFAEAGGLQALLTYLEETTNKPLTLVDTILVNESLQCLRAMMNIRELFGHIVKHPQYINSIAKILIVPSVEVRMHVFELLTALCAYSHDGYEAVLKAMANFQLTKKLSNVFVIVVEQLKMASTPKQKWSSIALVNSILLSTNAIEKRLAYRNVLFTSGLLPLLEETRQDANNDLNLQIDTFFEEQKRDEQHFLHEFDANDSQAIGQAIQLQFPPDSTEAASYLTLMQLLYSTLANAQPSERQAILQGLLNFVPRATDKTPEKKICERASQTDTFPQTLVVPSTVRENDNPTSTAASANIHIMTPDIKMEEKTIKEHIDSQTPPANPTTSLPPPPTSLPEAFSGSGPPLPPPPPPPPPMPLGQFATQNVPANISPLLKIIPHPKCKLRQLQWQKLPHSILTTSKFWADIANRTDCQIDFTELETFFKIEKQNSAALAAKKKVKPNILSPSRSIGINLFLRKFNYSNPKLLAEDLIDLQSNLTVECLQMLVKILPTTEEINQVHHHPSEEWDRPEQVVHELSSIFHVEFCVSSRILIIEFDEIVQNFKQTFEQIIETMRFIQQNASIKEFFFQLLLIGNFLNYGTYAGNALGFRLAIIGQLHNVRSVNNNNLLGVLLEHGLKDIEFSAGLKSMLSNAFQLKLAKEEYTVWKKKIVDGLKQVNTFQDDQITGQYKPFYEKAILQINNELDRLLIECDNQEKEFINQFGETNVTEFNYDSCCEIFGQLIEQIEEEKKTRERRLAAAKKRSISADASLSHVQKGHLENENSSTVKANSGFVDALMERVRQCKSRMDLSENNDQDQQSEEW